MIWDFMGHRPLGQGPLGLDKGRSFVVKMSKVWRVLV